jgi:hypothetical protein
MQRQDICVLQIVDILDLLLEKVLNWDFVLLTISFD